jgi:hypothetical protein
MPRRTPWGRDRARRRLGLPTAFERNASDYETKIPDINEPAPRTGKVVSLDSQWGGTSKGYKLACTKLYPVGAPHRKSCWDGREERRRRPVSVKAGP